MHLIASIREASAKVLRLVVICGLGAAGLLAGSQTAGAGEITISRGFLDLSLRDGPLTLDGDRGFTFRGPGVAAGAGRVDAFLAPGCPELCAPGSTIDLYAAWSDGDLRGDVTLDGVLFEPGRAPFFSSTSVEFFGALVLPPIGAATELHVPFTFSGRFSYDAANGHVIEALHGSGTVTMALAPAVQDPARWRMVRILYDFGSSLPDGWSSSHLGALPGTGATHSLGSALYNPATFYIDGVGADIWGRADAFRFTYRPAADVRSVSARVTAQRSSEALAKAGVMLRRSLDPGSAHVLLDLKPDGGLEFMARDADGGETTFIAGAVAVSLQPWLKLTREGDVFTAFQSVDGALWDPVGVVVVPIASDLLAGLAVTSRTNAFIDRVSFMNVDVSAAVMPVANLLVDGDFELDTPPQLGPQGWTSDDIRQTAAKSESYQPRSGRQNGACWTPVALDCGMWQELTAPASGRYRLDIHATADRPGGLVGANVNGMLAATANVTTRPFADYERYRLSFIAAAGDVIRIWMYSPATPGYVVIDDVALTLP